MTGTVLDRSEIARALAKAIAYAQCGKQHEAEEWAAELVRLLQCADILATPPVTPSSFRDDIASADERVRYNLDAWRKDYCAQSRR